MNNKIKCGLDAPPLLSPIRVLGAERRRTTVAPSAPNRLDSPGWTRGRMTVHIHHLAGGWALLSSVTPRRIGGRKPRPRLGRRCRVSPAAGWNNRQEGKVPWWPPAVCPAWHGELEPPTDRTKNTHTNTHTLFSIHTNARRPQRDLRRTQHPRIVPLGGRGTK